MRIENKISYDLCLFSFKVINHQFPNWLFRFPTVSERQLRTTRHSNDLLIKRTNTDIGTRAISVRGPIAWNDIPNDIQSTFSIKNFKEKLKNHFLQSDT